MANQPQSYIWTKCKALLECFHQVRPAHYSKPSLGVHVSEVVIMRVLPDGVDQEGPSRSHWVLVVPQVQLIGRRMVAQCTGTAWFGLQRPFPYKRQRLVERLPQPCKMSAGEGVQVQWP